MHETGKPPVVIWVNSWAWPNIIGFLKSFQGSGIPVYVAGDAEALSYLRGSLSCAGSIVFDLQDLGARVEQLCDWVARSGVGGRPQLYLLSDVLIDQLLAHRPVLERYFVLATQVDDGIYNIIDKSKCMDIVSAGGYRCPKTVCIDSASHVVEKLQSVVFPVVVKPVGYVNSYGFKVCIARDSGAAVDVLLSLVEKGVSCVVQEYIDGDDSDVYIYLFNRTREGVFFSDTVVRKLSQSPVGAGIMSLGVTVDDAEVVRISRGIVSLFDFWGSGGVELKRCEGELYFIEFNARCEGIHGISLVSGANVVKSMYDYLDSSVVSMNVPASGSYYLDEFSFFMSMRSDPMRYRSLKVILSAVLRGKVYLSLFFLRDPVPFARYTFRTVSVKVHRLLSRKGRRGQ